LTNSVYDALGPFELEIDELPFPPDRGGGAKRQAAAE
jgi:hypothetical protein